MKPMASIKKRRLGFASGIPSKITQGSKAFLALILVFPVTSISSKRREVEKMPRPMERLPEKKSEILAEGADLLDGARGV